MNGYSSIKTSAKSKTTKRYVYDARAPKSELLQRDAWPPSEVLKSNSFDDKGIVNETQSRVNDNNR